MEFDDVVSKRKMISKYLPKKIPDRTICNLIKNARRSPSTGRPQVQEFIIVGNPALKNTTRT
jgi:nitroreductase